MSTAVNVAGPERPVQRAGISYGWYIAWAGAGSSFLAFAFTTHGFGVFIKEFQDEFGWSVSAIALGFSIRSLEQGFLSPFTGYMVDRLGPRKMAILGIVLVALSMALMSQVRNLPMYYAASVGIALGLSIGSWNAYAAALMNWFHRQRGMVLAVMSVGIGAAYLGALIMGVLIEWVGWRGTLMMASVTILVLGVPLAFVIHDRPEDKGYLPDGERIAPASRPDGAGAMEPRRAEPLTGFTVGEALKTPAFYLLTLGQAASMAAQTAWLTFLIPHLQNVGFSVQMAGVLAAAYGIGQIIFRFVAGWAGDALGRHRIFAWGCVLLFIGMALFAFVSPDRFWLLPIVITVYGLGNAAFVIGSSTVAADYFGTKRFATLRGLMASFVVPVGIGVPLFVGWMVDRSGSYQLALLITAFGALTGALWLALVRRPLWGQDSQAG